MLGKPRSMREQTGCLPFPTCALQVNDMPQQCCVRVSSAGCKILHKIYRLSRTTIKKLVWNTQLLLAFACWDLLVMATPIENLSVFNNAASFGRLSWNVLQKLPPSNKLLFNFLVAQVYVLYRTKHSDFSQNCSGKKSLNLDKFMSFPFHNSKGTHSKNLFVAIYGGSIARSMDLSLVQDSTLLIKPLVLRPLELLRQTDFWVQTRDRLTIVTHHVWESHTFIVQ